MQNNSFNQKEVVFPDSIVQHFFSFSESFRALLKGCLVDSLPFFLFQVKSFRPFFFMISDCFIMTFSLSLQIHSIQCQKRISQQCVVQMQCFQYEASLLESVCWDIWNTFMHQTGHHQSSNSREG